MTGPAWYSWIPTNLGKLNFNYFAISKDISGKYKKIFKSRNRLLIRDLDIRTISDTYTPVSKWLDPVMNKLLPSLDGEIFASVDFFICQKNLDFTGVISLKYPEAFSVKANLDVKYNGKIKIDHFQYDLSEDGIELVFDKSFKDKIEFEDYLAQVIYILVKAIIHGDNHHHQKIDTAITVQRNHFSPRLIVKSLVQHIKRVEHDIKYLDRCYGQLKAKSAIDEMKGYRSYIKTFRSLFIKNRIKDKFEYVSNPQILDNIIDSLEASVNKMQLRYTYKSAVLSIILVYIALAISGAILYINLLNECNTVKAIHNWKYYVAFLLILFSVAVFHIKCASFSALFFKFYHLYEYLFHLEAIEHPKGIHKLIKFLWINKAAIFSLTIFGAFYAVKYFSL